MCSVGGYHHSDESVHGDKMVTVESFFCSQTQTHPHICLTYTIIHIHTCLLTGSLITLKQIVTSSHSDLQDYTYYFVPAPWLTVKLMRLLQCFPIPGQHIVSSVPIMSSIIVHVGILEMGNILYTV